MEEFILKEREVRENVVQIINNSGLPVVVLKSIIKDLYEQLNVAEIQEYQQALEIQKAKNEEKEEE